MDWPAWRPWSEAIAAEFGYDPAADADAAALLRPLARDGWDSLSARLAGQTCTVVGCGPSLAGVGRDDLPRPLVAADGATARLRELGVVPDAVVTDLDGDPDALAWAARAGAIMVVHAHGDNRAALRRAAPTLGPLLGTCQTDPAGLGPLRNVGGFTDGDRAVLLCEAMGAAGVSLIAFEPDAPPSAYSHAWDPATKPRKLAWAARIVADAAARGFPVARQPAGARVSQPL